MLFLMEKAVGQFASLSNKWKIQQGHDGEITRNIAKHFGWSIKHGSLSPCDAKQKNVTKSSGSEKGQIVFGRI